MTLTLAVTLEIIKIATRNGAQALGIERDVGSIESGKQADMISTV